ncbi:MAG: hypothetical protein HY554_03835 [Elusimicrobia bacterium]|nr:hypothetical protein [Elusimicrobiota bacterium]
MAFLRLALLLGLAVAPLRAELATPAAAELAQRGAGLARALESRAEYERRVRDICPRAQALLARGEEEERVARSAHAQRRLLGIQFKYRDDRTPPAAREAILRRNREKYGDPLGPTVAWLRAKGKSWGDIIRGSCKPGGADILPEILQPSP